MLGWVSIQMPARIVWWLHIGRVVECFRRSLDVQCFESDS